MKAERPKPIKLNSHLNLGFEKFWKVLRNSEALCDIFISLFSLGIFFQEIFNENGILHSIHAGKMNVIFAHPFHATHNFGNQIISIWSTVLYTEAILHL